MVAGVTPAGDVADGAALLGLSGAATNVGRISPVGVKRLGQGDLVTGSDGTTLPGTGALIGSEAAYTGIYALLKTDLFNLLCIPDATRAKHGAAGVVDSGLDPEAVWSAAYDVCERRRAVLLVDPPPGVDDPDRALDWINQLRVQGPNAVAPLPRLRIPDTPHGLPPPTHAPAAHSSPLNGAPPARSAATARSANSPV